MRALAHVSRPAAPDYTLRVPRALQGAIVLGVTGGLVGVGLLVGLPSPPLVSVFLLLALGAVSAIFSAGLWLITSTRVRQAARRRMLESVSWRGDEHVLDVGCGNGFLLCEAAKQLRTGRATGIDVWKVEAGEQSSQIARRNARVEGVAERIDIRNADARAMPFDDHSLDVIMASLMLHHAGGSADRDQVMREMVRVLKPGGTMLLYDVWPLIARAAGQLRATSFTSVERTGTIMTLLVARATDNSAPSFGGK